MRKEILSAIFLGLGLGLIVTYGTYTARRSLGGRQSSNLSATPTATPSTTDNSLLTLASPEDESIQATKDVRVTGTTKPNSIVIIFIQDQQEVTQADSSGNFSIQGTLETGANVIVVRAIDEDGNVTEVERTVILSTVDLDAPVASTAAKASPSPKATAKPSTKTATSSGTAR